MSTRRGRCPEDAATAKRGAVAPRQACLRSSASGARLWRRGLEVQGGTKSRGHQARGDRRQERSLKWNPGSLNASRWIAQAASRPREGVGGCQRRQGSRRKRQTLQTAAPRTLGLPQMMLPAREIAVAANSNSIAWIPGIMGVRFSGKMCLTQECAQCWFMCLCHYGPSTFNLDMLPAGLLLRYVGTLLD